MGSTGGYRSAEPPSTMSLMGELGRQIDPELLDARRDVYDPCSAEKGLSVVDMGLVHSAGVHGGVASVELLLTSGWCPVAARS